jgi:hypothetical protein
MGLLLLLARDRPGKECWNLRPGDVEARRQEGHFLLLSRDHRGEISLYQGVRVGSWETCAIVDRYRGYRGSISSGAVRGGEMRAFCDQNPANSNRPMRNCDAIRVLAIEDGKSAVLWK